MYLDVVDVPKATAAYERALKRAPRRTQSLMGLLKGARLSEDSRKRNEIQSQLDGIRHRADPDARLP